MCLGAIECVECVLGYVCWVQMCALCVRYTCVLCVCTCVRILMFMFSAYFVLIHVYVMCT